MVSADYPVASMPSVLGGTGQTVVLRMKAFLDNHQDLAAHLHILAIGDLVEGLLKQMVAAGTCYLHCCLFGEYKGDSEQLHLALCQCRCIHLQTGNQATVPVVEVVNLLHNQVLDTDVLHHLVISPSKCLHFQWMN